MTPLRLAALILSAGSLLLFVGSCKSDANPFDNMVNPVSEVNVAKIRLALDVASTRADDDLSTADERKIGKISVYVFDEHDQLEKFKADISVSSDSPAELEVTPGQKTLYAIASKTMMSGSLAIGTTMAKFEETVFASTLSDLKTSDGFVMVGKSEPQQVLKSANENEVPASNVFNIEMVRLLSKTQVKIGTLDASDFGFRMEVPTFCVSQTSDRMRLVANEGKEIQASYKDTDGNGTYDGYTVCPDSQYKKTASNGFTADGCHYITENIVGNPVAGNTTFVSLCVPFTPINIYTFNEATKALTKAPNSISNISFFAVGVVDETYGFEDFALDPDTHHVLAFGTKDDADAYVRSLNSGSASAITVSETEAPLRAPGAGTYDVNHREFQTVTFNMGKSYYRINIATANGNFKVVRNKFYKIDVKKISSIGFHSEDLLRPKDPSSDPGNSTSAWIEAVLTVAPWEEVKQDANL